jgi:sensor histidine kinase YesM
VTASGNIDFLTSVEKKNQETLTRNAKIVYEGNPFIRRLVFLNQQGDPVGIYPYGVFDKTNYAFREYFIRTRDTKAPYVSSIFDTNISQMHRPVVSVSVPLLDEKGVFQGLINASINLEKTSLQLQQLAVESGGEFFTVVDNAGRYVIHPNVAIIGTNSPDKDVARKGAKKAHGIEEVVFPDGRLGLAAYDYMPSLGWGISVQVPTASILELSTFSLIITFGTLFVVYVLAILLLYLMRFRWTPQQKESP